jgi:hypothetical protein
MKFIYLALLAIVMASPVHAQSATTNQDNDQGTGFTETTNTKTERTQTQTHSPGEFATHSGTNSQGTVSGGTNDRNQSGSDTARENKRAD